MLAATQSDAGAPSSTEDLREAPPVSEAMLAGTFWRFSDLDEKKSAPFLVLAPDGLVGNFLHPSADCWQVVDGRLCLIDRNGLPSVVFNVARLENGRIVTLAGRGVIEGVTAIWMLNAVDHPPHPLFATPQGVERRARFIRQPAGGPLRPNLVVVPANAQSLHPHWLRDVTGPTRNWDLCVGHYGAEEPVLDTPHEYLAHLPGRRKFRLIYDLFHEDSPLWNYEYIWLPDDDLLCSGTDINVMFHLVRKHGLDLAQPSLRNTPDCHINHPITVQRPNSIVRQEPFIEIMCPVFSQRALKICIGSMKDTQSGYGLDHLWPSFLGQPATRTAVVDAVSVVHTRPIGATYDVRGAVAEQAAIFAVYQHTPRKIAGVW